MRALGAALRPPLGMRWRHLPCSHEIRRTATDWRYAPMALDRRSFLHSTAGVALGLAVPAAWAQRAPATPGVRIRLIRNATCVIQYAGRTILLDPFLSDAGALPAFNNTPNPRPNPLVPLPVPAEQILT